MNNFEEIIIEVKISADKLSRLLTRYSLSFQYEEWHIKENQKRSMFENALIEIATIIKGENMSNDDMIKYLQGIAQDALSK